MKKISFLALVLAILVFWESKTVLAAEDLAGFSVAPFFQEVELVDGQTAAKFSLEVSNSQDFPVVFRLSVVDFGALNESGGVAFIGSGDGLNNKYGLASWMSLDRDAIVVSPGEKQAIQGRIENKDSLSPGGHYAAVVMKMENDNEQATVEDAVSKISVAPTVAALIFTRKVGGEILGLDLKENNLENNFFGLPEMARLRFQNTGNVYATPRGTVKMFDPLKREVAKGVINNESAFILPETFRVFPVSLKEMSRAFLPGKYVVLTEYRYDGKEDFFTQKQTVFIFPAVAMVFTGIIVIVIILYLKFSFKKSKKNKQKKDDTGSRAEEK